MYQEALEFAKERHTGQKRWDGTDYIRHPISVADNFSDDVRKTVAVLHDVVEDTKTTIQEVKERFGSKVSSAVDSLTRKSGETYNDFIKRVARNPIAKDIKIADIEDNIGDVPKEDKFKEKAENLKRNRYIPALLFLKGQEKEF